MVTLQKAVTRAGHVLWVRVLNTKLSTGEKLHVIEMSVLRLTVGITILKLRNEYVIGIYGIRRVLETKIVRKESHPFRENRKISLRGVEKGQGNNDHNDIWSESHMEHRIYKNSSSN